jgi:hypothetical protein
MTFIVAYHVPHNEGVEMGIITGAGFDGNGDDFNLTDLYEVDASVRSFDTVAEATDWLGSRQGDGREMPELEEVPGGLIGRFSYEEG